MSCFLLFFLHLLFMCVCVVWMHVFVVVSVWEKDFCNGLYMKRKEL